MPQRRDVLKLGVGTAAGAAVLMGGRTSWAGPLPEPPGPRSHDQPEPGAWRELEQALGPGARLHRPGSEGFHPLAEPDNLRYAHVLPAGIVSCASRNDVRAALLWSRKHGVPLVPRSGGHNYAGYSTTTGLLINLRRMNGVRPDGRWLWLGGGATNSDVYAARATNLYFPGGRCPGVGVAGLTLGGGLGFNDRKWGMTCDRLVETEVVLADGSVVRANDRENTDLFWACRGGAGGNFGINTAFGFRPVSVDRQTATVFDLVLDLDAGERLMDRVQEALVRDVAGDLDVRVAFARRAEDERPAVALLGQYLGTDDRLHSLLRPIRELRTRKDFVQQRHFWSAQDYLLTNPEKSAMSSRSLAPNRWLDAATVAEVVEWVRDWRPGPAEGTGYVTLFAMGGESAVPGPGETAYPHRDATFVIDVGTHWRHDARRSDVAELLSRTSRIHRTLAARLRTRAAYVNFPDPDLTDWHTAYYGANYERLVAVKKRYDPSGTFHYPQAIGSA
ncbi:FAD-binding oxidoreductase [Streptomyces sp. OF3]|uniref:FAD-binding oxidoreductase n=1 Tax=Streptomyces alkaliterrae TaxID=2213162 RepID=A0A7W3WIC5_9ACTN|nr:FAD-binding oxidoreductase [Streptomyces alkaliterrae]MBB1252863.1 FAD-binding oxidoreductase [Streptomyces alkaliterrae]